MTSFHLHLVACVISFLGFLLIIIGVATPEWTLISQIKMTTGLWEGCLDSTCIKYSSLPGEQVGDAVRTCEAFGILSILAGIASFGALVAFTFLSHLKKVPSPLILTMARIAGVATAIFVIITTAVWGAKNYTDVPGVKLGYSFALTVVGGGLSLIAAIISCCTHTD